MQHTQTFPRKEPNLRVTHKTMGREKIDRLRPAKQGVHFSSHPLFQAHALTRKHSHTQHRALESRIFVDFKIHIQYSGHKPWKIHVSELKFSPISEHLKGSRAPVLSCHLVSPPTRQ